ncbi:MAG: cupredoxin domain-containing protein [Chitinophagales bacterium]|nr:cupredoxin domain-containing protein [Chitinophagales bacterium]
MTIKSAFPVFSTYIALLYFTACNSNQQQTSSDAQDTSSYHSQPLVYDPDKIDASAPVMEFTLNAIGNSMDVMSYSMADIHVKSGSTIKIHFSNTAKDSALKHNFFIVKTGTMEQVATAGNAAGPAKEFVPDDRSNVLYHSPLLNPGQSADLVFAAPPFGNYQFVCTYPGHWQKMNGKFIVE